MKLQVLRENLTQAVSDASRVISNKPNLPVLSNLLLTATEDQLTIEASNLETSMRVNVRAKIEKPGKITLPARKLSDYLNTLTESKLTLEEKESKFVVSSQNSEGQFVTLPPDDFPALPTAGEQQFKMGAPKFAELIEKTTFAASGDEVRPVLTGVHLKFESNKKTGVATDGFRLSEFKTDWDGGGDQLKPIIVPAKALQEVARVLEGGEAQISLSEDENQIIFASDGVEVISRLLEAEYPDYQQIIPGDFTTQAVFNREELINKVRLAAIFARREGQTVRVVFDSEDQQVILRSQSSEVGEQEGKLAGEVQGTPMEVGFNAGYLLDGLNSLESEKVRLKLKEGGEGRVAPVVFLPEGDEETDSSYLHIVMPVRLEQ